MLRENKGTVNIYLNYMTQLYWLSGSVRVVTDSVEGLCVDPGEKGAILEARGPSPPGGGKGWQLATDSGGEGT